MWFKILVWIAINVILDFTWVGRQYAWCRSIVTATVRKTELEDYVSLDIWVFVSFDIWVFVKSRSVEPPREEEAWRQIENRQGLQPPDNQSFVSQRDSRIEPFPKETSA